MNATSLVAQVWIWFRVRTLLPTVVVLLIVPVLLLGTGCGGSSSSPGSSLPPPPPQARVYAGQGQPFGVDFNRDGKPDVLTSDGTMNLGSGNGTFHAATHVALPAGFELDAVADFNGDGKPDLLARNCLYLFPCTTLSVFLGNGDGTFQTTPVSTTATLERLAAGDLNGDGKADVVAASNGTLFVYLSNGDGTFEFTGTYNSGFSDGSVGSSGVALGDFNGDGKTDVVVTTTGDFYSRGQVIVFLGNGDGTFQAPKASIGAYGNGSIAVEDFNGDGKLDLVMSGVDLIAGSVEWVQFGNGDGTFQTPNFFGPVGDPLDGIAQIAAGDFRGDGKKDLALQAGSIFNNHAEIYLGNGDGTFTHGNDYTPGGPSTQISPFGITIADFNGDGKLDIAVANSVLLGKGDGTFQ
jgi:hypothetical protein